MQVEYYCTMCNWKASKNYNRMLCIHCNGDMKGSGPTVIGTETSFGIGRKFIDDETGKEIKTYKEWEKAGYRNPVETHKGNVQQGIKRKIDKCKNFDTKKRFNV